MEHENTKTKYVNILYNYNQNDILKKIDKPDKTYSIGNEQYTISGICSALAVEWVSSDKLSVSLDKLMYDFQNSDFIEKAISLQKSTPKIELNEFKKTYLFKEFHDKQREWYITNILKKELEKKSKKILFFKYEEDIKLYLNSKTPMLPINFDLLIKDYSKNYSQFNEKIEEYVNYYQKMYFEKHDRIFYNLLEDTYKQVNPTNIKKSLFKLLSNIYQNICREDVIFSITLSKESSMFGSHAIALKRTEGQDFLFDPNHGVFFIKDSNDFGEYIYSVILDMYGSNRNKSDRLNGPSGNNYFIRISSLFLTDSCVSS